MRVGEQSVGAIAVQFERKSAGTLHTLMSVGGKSAFSLQKNAATVRAMHSFLEEHTVKEH